MLGFGRSKEVSKVVSLNSLRVPKKSGLTRASLVATLILLSSSFGSNKKSFAEDQPASPVPVNPSAEFLKVHQYDALMHVARNHPEAGHFLAKVNERYEQYTERMKIWGNLPVEQRAREGDIEHPKTRFRNGIRSDSIDVVEARFERVGQSVSRPSLKDLTALLKYSKNPYLKRVGIVASLPFPEDIVKKIHEGTKKFNDLYPRDPAKLENAARQFTMNLEGNSALGELVKDDFKVIFGFDLDATQLEINSAYPELANADLQSVSS
ncbi:MAG: hypothetical protein KDD56_10380, partial [Bdellovibrionales bacterium]|nr:hypothetical protein [Bdellovibrionales bacterium]